MPSKIMSIVALAAIAGAGASASTPVRHLSVEFGFIECYADGIPRIMGDMEASSPDMTNERCAELCEGSMYFGTQYGTQCFCGDESTDFEHFAPSGACTMPCSGDPTFDVGEDADAHASCGGLWAMAVYDHPLYEYEYETPIPTGYCSNGLPGIDGFSALVGMHVCCPVECNQCGGAGCNSNGEPGFDTTSCCVHSIIVNQDDCTVSQSAPCFM